MPVRSTERNVKAALFAGLLFKAGSIAKVAEPLVTVGVAVKV
jgi:hypothetical protein